MEFNIAMTLFKFAPSNVMVTLLGGGAAPLAAWMFVKAFPVRWATADLSASEDQVLIDTLELCYASMQVDAGVIMTIEIKQLIIRAVVEDRRERPAAPAAPAERRRVRAGPSHAPADIAVDREAVIAACTRQVLRELQRGRGR